MFRPGTQRSKEGIESPAIGVMNGCEPRWVLGTEPWFSNSNRYFLNPGHLDPLLFSAFQVLGLQAYANNSSNSVPFFFELGFTV